MPLVRLDTAPIDESFRTLNLGGDQAQAAKPAAAAEPPASADPRVIGVAYLVIAAGALLGIALWSWRNPAGFTAGAGISVFAPLYILAQAIERFIEPFTSMLGAKTPDGTSKTKKAAAVDQVNKALVAGDAQKAAQWQRVVDQIRANTAVVAWGAASFLGIVAERRQVRIHADRSSRTLAHTTLMALEARESPLHECARPLGLAESQ